MLSRLLLDHLPTHTDSHDYPPFSARLAAPVSASPCLSLQPADLLVAINLFLDSLATVCLFRCDRRLYNLPLQPGMRERLELKPIQFIRYYSTEDRVVIRTGSELEKFRFSLSSLNLRGLHSWAGLAATAQRNPKLFSRLRHLELSITPDVLDLTWLPKSLESLFMWNQDAAPLNVIIDIIPKLTNFKSLEFRCDDAYNMPSINHLNIERLKLHRNNVFRSGEAAQDISSSLLPVTLRELHLFNYGHSRRGPISFSELIHLESLTMPKEYNQQLSRDMFPSSLKHLHLGEQFNWSLDATQLPEQLESLILSAQYNKPLRVSDFPCTLKSLELSTTFHSPLLPENLPNSLTCLSFTPDCAFNYPLMIGSLPPNLKILRLNKAFQRILARGVLPNSLEELSLGAEYTQPLLAGSLPPRLRKLTIGMMKHPMFPSILPASLEELKLTNPHFFPLPLSALPPKVRFTFDNCQLDIPHALLSPEDIISKGEYVQMNTGDYFHQKLGLYTDSIGQVIDILCNSQCNQSKKYRCNCFRVALMEFMISPPEQMNPNQRNIIHATALRCWVSMKQLERLTVLQSCSRKRNGEGANNQAKSRRLR